MCVRTTINNQYKIAKQINQIQKLSIEMIDSNRVYVRCKMKNGTTKYFKLKCQYAKNQEPYIDAIGISKIHKRKILRRRKNEKFWINSCNTSGRE